MSVIIKDMDMPKSCYDCPLCEEECFGAYKCIKAEYWGSDESRADDCPIKSVDGLIEKIEAEISSDVTYCEYYYGLIKAIETIKEYCEVSEN